MTALHSTPTYGVPNGTEIRVTVEGWSARLKVTAGALGIVDIYEPGGVWTHRVHWSPFAGFREAMVWCPAVEFSLALAFHHYVNNRPVARPRQRRAA